jgi:hypothetical protein
MYCLCVNVYCHRVTTQLQLINISYKLLGKIPGIHWIGGWVGPDEGLHGFGGKKKNLTLPGLEPRTVVTQLWDSSQKYSNADPIYNVIMMTNRNSNYVMCGNFQCSSKYKSRCDVKSRSHCHATQNTCRRIWTSQHMVDLLVTQCIKCQLWKSLTSNTHHCINMEGRLYGIRLEGWVGTVSNITWH